jgi:uncharacterized protein (TIRG00374 family)
MLIPSVALLAVEFTFRIVRWWTILRKYDPEIQLRSCAWPLIVGFAINNVLPLRLGDFARVVGFRREIGIAPVKLLASIIVERLLDVTVLLAFLLIGLAILGTEKIPLTYLELMSVIVGIAAITWIALTMSGDRLQDLLLRICQNPIVRKLGLMETAERQVHGFAAALTVVRSPSFVVRLLGISVLVWCLDGAIFATTAGSLGYAGHFYGPWFALASATLATLVPSAPGYVGTFDFFAIWGFMAYGTGRTVATAIAVLVHAIFWISLNTAGVVFIVRSKLPFLSRPARPIIACDDE